MSTAETDTKKTLELRPSFLLVENRTLTGKKLLAGDCEFNSYILVKPQMAEAFKDLVSTIKSGSVQQDLDSLDEVQKKLVWQMDAKGFFRSSHTPQASFNELNSFARIIFKKEFSDEHPDVSARQGNDHVRSSIFLLCVAAMVLYVISNRGQLNRTFDISSSSTLTYILATFLVPTFICALHELGHFVVAKALRIPAATFQFGFFVVYPVAYLTYRGLNLTTTLKKTCILLGGIAGHLAGASVSLLLLNSGFDGAIIDFWMLGNISMIFTNLSLIGVTDGYYTVCSLLGIYNLRLMGYSAFKKIMRRELPSAREGVCGSGLLALWIFSFFMIYRNIGLNLAYFNTPDSWAFAISVSAMLALVLGFALKLRKLKL